MPLMSDMGSGLSLDISQAFNSVWLPALLSKLSPCGTQAQFHTWLTYLIYSHSQLVALHQILSSALHVKAGVPHGSVLAPVLFLIFKNDLSDFLQNPHYLFAEDSTLCHD